MSGDYGLAQSVDFMPIWGHIVFYKHNLFLLEIGSALVRCCYMLYYFFNDREDHRFQYGRGPKNEDSVAREQVSITVF